MPNKIEFSEILEGCADESIADGIRIDSELEPLSGPRGLVKPAIYAGGTYQHDRRWASPTDGESTEVIVIDNVPSQANRLEDALRKKNRHSSLIPEFRLDLSDLPLPSHLPKSISSLQFPHRNADAYLRDAELDGQDFLKTKIGQDIFSATAQTCGPLIAWFPQALLYGFWQSHLGKKRPQTKHSRAWVSEIIGWQPASIKTKVLGLKGDPLNLNIDDSLVFDSDDLTDWEMNQSEKKKGGKVAKKEGKVSKLSEIGHGQALVKEESSPGAISFRRVTQRATVSFAQLRRVSLGSDSDKKDAAVRALLVALGLHAHQLAFGKGFALRSGAELRPVSTAMTWLSADGDKQIDLGTIETTEELLGSAKKEAESCGVPLDGWGMPATRLTPKENVRKAIQSTWPELPDVGDQR